MNMSKLIVWNMIVSIVFLWGCAPSVTVTQAGDEKQFEITVSSNDFTDETEEIIETWHEKARETCSGNNYKVITRDIIQKEEPLRELLITGIVECQ